MRISTLLTTLCALLLAAGCGDGGSGKGPPTGPNPQTPAFRDPPETAPRQLVLGDTVTTEKVDSTGDIDEFVFDAPAGGLVTLVFQATGGFGQTLLALVRDSAGTHEPVRVESSFAEGVRPTRRVELTPGRWVVRVMGLNGSAGPYRFSVHETRRQPEAADSVLPAARWVEESTDPYYDVDEFVFDGTAGQEVAVFGETGTARYLRMTVRAPGQSDPDSVYGRPFEPHASAMTGVFRLPATGRYRVGVRVPDYATQTVQGSYRVMYYPIVRTPESAPAALVDRQPVRESTGMPGDVDEFTFAAAAGELLRLDWGSDDPYLEYRLALTDAVTGQEVAGRLTRFTSDQARTLRLTITPRPQLIGRVPDSTYYSLQLVRLNRAPEHVSAAMVQGREVTGESIDVRGDVDEFTFAGTAGQEVAVLGELGPGLTLDMHREDTGERLAHLVAWPGAAEAPSFASPRLTLPVTGTYRVRVWDEMNDPVLVPPAPETPVAYKVTVAPVSRAPESVPAALTLGQTVEGESLSIRDVDVFTFNAQAGDRLVLWGARPVIPGSNQPLTMFVDGPGNNGVQGYIWVDNGGTSQQTFTAAGAGSYTVTVVSSNQTSAQFPDGEGRYVGGYRLRLSAAP